ncbi:MAG TPA: hypothetical protein ENH82_00015 [bacterium]|nr:hypothetical protein [bacterium]
MFFINIGSKSGNSIMRIFLIFEETPFFMPEYLRRFLKRQGHNVIGFTPSYTEKAYPKRAKEGNTFFAYARKHPFRFGFKALFFYGFKTIFYKVINTFLPFFGLNSPYTVRGVAKKYNIPIIDTISVNDRDYLNKLRELEIDIIVSTNGQIFKKDILSLPGIASLNVHTSILPGYGGCYPALFYLLNKESMYGISCHTMEEKIDGGIVVAQRRFPIEIEDTVTSLYAKAYGIADVVLEEGINNLISGQNFPDVSDIEPSYYGFPTEEDFNKLFSSGRKFL